MNDFQVADRIFPAKFIFLQNVVVCNGNDFPLALYNAALCSEIHMFGWSPDGECLVLRRRYLHEIFPLSNSDSLERCHNWLVVKLWTHGFNQLLKEKLTSEDILEQVEYFFNPRFTRNEIFRQICTPTVMHVSSPQVPVMLQSPLVESSVSQYLRDNTGININGMIAGCQALNNYQIGPNNTHTTPSMHLIPRSEEGTTSNDCDMFVDDLLSYSNESRHKTPEAKPSKFWKKLRKIQTSNALRSKLGFLLPTKKADDQKKVRRPSLFTKPLKAPKRPYKVGPSLFSSRERREIIDNIFNPFHERRNIVSEWFSEYRLQDEDEDYDSAEEWELDEEALMDDIEKAYFAPANPKLRSKGNTESPRKRRSTSLKLLSPRTPRRSKVEFSKEFIHRFGSAYLRMKEEKKQKENEAKNVGQAAVTDDIVDVVISNSYDLNYSNLYCSKKASEILRSSQQQSQIENAVNSII